MRSLAALAFVLALVASRAAAQTPPSVAQVLAACRRPHATPVAAFHPTPLQATGIASAVPRAGAPPDEVLYREATAAAAAGNMLTARQTFLRVIRSYPTSVWVPYVYLSFGEYYFAQGDMQAAEQFYDKVLDFPAAAPGLFALVRYRLGWVHRNLGDELAARDAFVKVLGLALTSPTDPDVQQTAAATRVEICGP